MVSPSAGGGDSEAAEKSGSSNGESSARKMFDRRASEWAADGLINPENATKANMNGRWW